MLNYLPLKPSGLDILLWKVLNLCTHNFNRLKTVYSFYLLFSLCSFVVFKKVVHSVCQIYWHVYSSYSLTVFLMCTVCSDISFVPDIGICVFSFNPHQPCYRFIKLNFLFKQSNSGSSIFVCFKSNLFHWFLLLFFYLFYYLIFYFQFFGFY